LQAGGHRFDPGTLHRFVETILALRPTAPRLVCKSCARTEFAEPENASPGDTAISGTSRLAFAGL
jgi:hypothetical protein